MAQLQSTGVTGSLVVTGTITAQEFHTEFVSSSILHESGSTVFGNSSDDTHIFTGTLTTTGQLDLQGALNLEQPLGDNTFITLNNKDTASDVSNQKSFIDFKFIDSNTNETPQVRIGAHVGNNDGDASSLGEEGMGAFVVYTNNADTDAGEAGASLAERFRVDRLGNVGIGTTSPTKPLDVRTDIGVLIKGASGSTNAKISLVPASGGRQYDLGNVGSDFRIFDASANVTRMYFDNDGNTGIGTTSPASKLQVGDYMSSNVLTIGGWYGGGGGTLAFKSGYVPNAAYVWDTARIKATDDGNFNGRIEFQTSTVGRAAPDTKMVLKASGNLGIGVTNPHGKLSFANSVETRKIVLYESGNNDFQFYGFGIESNALIYNTAANTDDHIFFSGASTATRNELMRIEGTGNVGIGTTSPSHLLTLEAASSPGLKIKDTTQGATLLAFSQDSNSHIGTYSSHPLVFDTNSTERMRIDQTGNVGIGTTSPGAKLELKGSTAGETVLDIQGTQGQLFAITDSLVGDIFSVSDISGVPILNVNSSGAVNIDGTLTIDGAVSASNLSGTNTGDQTDIAGNAATVTTNANLTGHITSVGNAAVLGSFTAAQLSTALSNATISGDNTGDQTLPTTLPPATSDTLDFFQDNSGVSLHQFNNSLDDAGGNYAATSTGASYGTGLDTRFGSHGINTQGDGTYVDIAGLPTIQAVSIWYKAIGNDNGYIVDFRHDNPGNSRSYLYTLAGSDQYISWSNDTTRSGSTGDIWINGVSFPSGQYNFTSGNWYHIVLTTNTVSTAQTWDQGIRIGNRSDGTSAGNAGYFDQVRTFNRRLTSADVALLYAEVETGATADQTAGEILSLIKTVDGASSGLDADLLDGNQATAFAPSSVVNQTDFVSAANGGTFSGALKITDAINAGSPILDLHNSTNGESVDIRFTDVGAGTTQFGNITYRHQDSKAYGSAAVFTIGSGEATTTILADGKLMYNEGIYSKPATGTGAGTRKDSNWDTAYGWGNHADGGYTGDQDLSGYLLNTTDTLNGYLSVATKTVADGGTYGENVISLTGTSQVTSTNTAVTPTNALILKPALAAGYSTDGYNLAWEIQSSANRILYYRTSGAGALSLDVEGTVTANGITLTGNQTLPSDFVSAASGGTFSGNIDASNLSGTNSGDNAANTNASLFIDRGALDLTSATGGNNGLPFDNNHTETKISENGMRTLSYTGASAFMYTFANGGSASVVQLGAHYNGNDFYMRTRTDGSTWNNWRKLYHDNNIPTWNQDTSGNAATVTNGVYTTGAQTIGGIKTLTARLNSNSIIDTGTGTSPNEKGVLLNPNGSITVSSSNFDLIEIDSNNNRIRAFTGSSGAGNLNFPTTGGTNYSWTLPLATGTIALTSNLTSYLPLVGGTLSGDLTVNGGNISINNNNGGILYNDASSYWIRTATNWGLYWNTGNNTLGFHGAGTERGSIDLDNGNLQMDGTGRFGTYVATNTSSTRGKFRLWDTDSAYVIGMKSGYSFGHLGGTGTEYAMSFQMSDTADRGFWWGDASHSDAKGAMSLTTTGKATIARTLSVGEGETQTNPSNSTLYVKGETAGDTVLDIQGTLGQLFAITDNLVGDIFSVSDISGVPILNVNSSGTSYFDGNLGIGTTSPSAKLEIIGDATGDDTAQLIIKSGGVDNNSIIHFTDDEGDQVNAIGSLEGNMLTLASQNELVFKTNTSSIVGTANTKMTILTGGNVGIGTITPASKLEVYGSAPFIYITDDTETESGIIFRDIQAGMSQAAAIKFSSSDNKLRFYNNDTTAERMVIDINGNVGIGTNVPAYKLDVTGTIRATGDIIAYSDARVKENIKTIDSALDKVSNLRGVEFNKIGEEIKSIGVIAQEIEKVIPEVVRVDDKGMKSVAYGNITGVLIEAIKEQQTIVNQQQKEINTLKELVGKLINNS